MLKNFEEFKEHVVKCYPQEACGIVIDDVFLPIENIASDPINNFEFSQKDSLALLGKEYKVLHSHTDESYSIDPRTPSLNDMKGRYATQVPWGIVHCDGENISDILWFGGINEIDLLGRTYISNVYDCFTLARDFYYTKFDIDVGLHPRPTDWEEWDPYYIEHTYSKLGFVEVKIPTYGDVVLLSIGTRYINHIGIFIKDDTFIHHLFARKSSEDSLKKWNRQLIKILRLADAKKTI